MPLFECLIIYVKGLPLQIHVRHGTTFPPTPALITPTLTIPPHDCRSSVQLVACGGGVAAHPPDPNRPPPPQTLTVS
jgi:hypothetical protein